MLCIKMKFPGPRHLLCDSPVNIANLWLRVPYSCSYFVPRERRPYLLSKWRVKGGVLLIGYASFRNLSLGKHVRDRNAAAEMCHILQVKHHTSDIHLSKEK